MATPAADRRDDEAGVGEEMTAGAMPVDITYGAPTFLN